MQSRLVFRRNRVIFDHCSKRYYWSVKGHSEPPFVRCFPIRQQILYISQGQQHSTESAHHSSSRPDCDSTADVHSFTLRPALSAIPFVSGLRGFDVQWFQERSSQYLPNSRNCHLSAFGFLVGSRNFMRFFCVFWEVLVLHGWDCNHCVAKSCSTTANRWLFRDSPSSLGTLLSAVIKSPKMFRSGHDCTSTSSARSPRYFRLQADIAIRTLRKVRKYTVRTRTRFDVCSRLQWRFMRRTGSVCTPLHQVSPKLFWSTFIEQCPPGFL